MKKLPHTQESGTTLIEVLVVIVLIGLFVIPFLLIVNRLNNSFAKLGMKSQGLYFTQRNLEIFQNISQKDWEKIKTITQNQPYHIEGGMGTEWIFVSGNQTSGPFTSHLVTLPVCRTAQYEAVDCSNVASQGVDTNSIRVMATTTWTSQGIPDSISIDSMYTKIF